MNEYHGIKSVKYEYEWLIWFSVSLHICKLCMNGCMIECLHVCVWLINVKIKYDSETLLYLQDILIIQVTHEWMLTHFILLISVKWFTLIPVYTDPVGCPCNHLGVSLYMRQLSDVLAGNLKLAWWMRQDIAA